MNLISLAIVVYFHFVLMFYTINRQEPPKDPPPPPKKERRKDSLKIRFVEKQGSRVTACRHYYVGIGIIHSFLNEVSYVAPGDLLIVTGKQILFLNCLCVFLF